MLSRKVLTASNTGSAPAPTFFLDDWSWFASQTSLTLATEMPGITDGDCMVLVIGGGITGSDPSGWTRLEDNSRYSVFVKEKQSSDTTVSFTSPNSGYIFNVRGGDAANANDGGPVLANITSGFPVKTINTPNADVSNIPALVFVFGGSTNVGETSVSSLTPPTNFSQVDKEGSFFDVIWFFENTTPYNTIDSTTTIGSTSFIQNSGSTETFYSFNIVIPEKP